MRALAIGVALLCCGCAGPLERLRVDTQRVPWRTARYVPPVQDNCQRGVEHLRRRAADLGIALTVLADDENEAGLYDEAAATIALSSRLNSCGTLEVLAHELAHALQPWHPPASVRQVYADGVSYLVVRTLGGYDPRARYARYLAIYKHDIGALEHYHADIEATAAWLISSAPLKRVSEK